jgi:TolC family type I secretion outer membrane protein
MRAIAVLSLSLLLLALEPSQASAQTLPEALAFAYKNNPALLAARAKLRATDEGLPQALAGWRPSLTVSGEGGYARRETQPASPVFGGRSELKPLTATAELSQSVYSGGRTLAQTRAAEAQILAGRAELQTAEQDVLLAAVTAYTDVIRDQAVVELTRNNEQVLQKHLEATRNRFEVGELTRTDIAQAEARLSRARADRVTAEGALAASRAAFLRAVGMAPATLTPPPPLPSLPANEGEAQSVADEGNPQLLLARSLEESARHDIRAASGALLPDVSLNASLSRNEESSIRDFTTEDARVTAKVTVPIYESGLVYSQVRQLKQISDQRRKEIDDARRQVRESVTQAWEAFGTARANIAARQAQIQASTIALEGVSQEAEVGARTVLDVLDAEQELLDAKVAFARAERDEYVAGFTLLEALGRLTVRDLALPVELYDPAENYDRVRGKWFGLDDGLD